MTVFFLASFCTNLLVGLVHIFDSIKNVCIIVRTMYGPGIGTHPRFGTVQPGLFQCLPGSGRQGHLAYLQLTGRESQRVSNQGHGRRPLAMHSYGIKVYTAINYNVVNIGLMYADSPKVSSTG